MKNLIAFVIQQKILLAILGVGVAILGFQIWKYQDEQYQKLLAKQQVLCEKSIGDAHDTIRKSKSLLSAYKPKLLGTDVTPREKIRQPGINSSFKSSNGYILIRSDRSPLIPMNTPHYKSIYFESNSKPPGGKTLFAAIVIAEPLNDKEALVTTPCSPKPFATPLKDLYEIYQPEDLTSPNPFNLP